MDYLVEELEEADYESDTPIPPWEEENSKVSQRHDVSPARTLPTPCLFTELSTSEMVSLLTSTKHRSCSWMLSIERLPCVRIHGRF
ncbi:hypothetical protein Plhal304r1_c001g0001021 [Plasmopara halstedii]